MSFKSNILIFISVMLMVLLVGTFGLNMSTTQDFLEKQLQSHSYDTANSLGLSLSSVSGTDSNAQTMIDAIFDRGHFSIIELVDMNGESIYKRTNETINTQVPSWFVNAIDVDIATSHAVVQKGWIPIGKLHVKAQNDYVYIKLWLVFKSLIQWFCTAAIIFLTSAYFSVRFLLRPLQKAQQQAHAIVNKEYILQNPLPATTEFRHLASAMNSMVIKLEKVFTREAQVAEKLRAMAYQDSVTGLYNRHYFDMTFNSIVDEEQTTAHGSVCLLKINGLKELNTHYGYQLGNELVKHVAQKFHNTLDNRSGFYARLSGIELIAVLPNIEPLDIKQKASSLLNYPQTLGSDLNLDHMPISLSFAISRYKPNESKSNLFSQLDFLIQQTDAQNAEPIQLQPESTEQSFNNQHWQELIQTAITEKRFQLFQQEAYDTHEQIYDSELLVRMTTEDGKIQPAAYFMPAVEQLNMQTMIDALVLELISEHLEESNSQNHHSINLSKALLSNKQLFEGLLPQFKKAKGAKLTFEFPESAVYENLDTTHLVFKSLRELGFKVGIDRFGIQVADLSYLKNLKPDYIKLDASFSDQIETDDNTISYVGSICEAANNLDIDVFAMSIEKDSQVQAFKKAGVSYFQGYYFSSPIPL